MRVLLRCDASPEIGVGHVVRCIALAEEALERGHDVALLGQVEGALVRALADRTTGLRLLGPAPRDLSELVTLIDGVDVLHVDSYAVGELDELLSACMHPPVLSTMHDGEFGLRRSDLTVDPTPGSDAGPLTNPSEWSLQGSRYVPIRRSVMQHAVVGTGPEPAMASDVLVIMGGTDPTGSAPHVTRALLATGLPLRITVVASAGTRAVLEDMARVAGGRVDVREPVPDLAPLISASDLVVTAAGSTVWEVCALRRPMAVVMAADNQAGGYAQLVDAGACLGLGGLDDVRESEPTAALLSGALRDGGLRAQVAESAHRFVDGRGSWRIVAAWEELVAGAQHLHDRMDLRARAVMDQDAELLWQWRNDPATRALSRTSDPIPLEEHRQWLAGTLARSDRVLLIARDSAGDVGTVRWDDEGAGEWEVSITVAPDRRGQGLARPLLAVGEDALAQRRPDALRLLAVVHDDNQPSRRLFTSSGYLPDLPSDSLGFARWTKRIGSS